MRGRAVWWLIGGFLLFLVVFQVVETLVGPGPARDAAAEPPREPEPVRLEVTRPDRQTVQIDVGSERVRIRLDDGPPDEADALFDCLNDGIARLDPSLTGHAPGNLVARRRHESKLSKEVAEIREGCLIGPTESQR